MTICPSSGEQLRILGEENLNQDPGGIEPAQQGGTMKKQLATVGLAAALTLSLAGCGGQAIETVTTTPTPQAQVKQVGEEVSGEVATFTLEKTEVKQDYYGSTITGFLVKACNTSDETLKFSSEYWLAMGSDGGRYQFNTSGGMFTPAYPLVLEASSEVLPGDCLEGWMQVENSDEQIKELQYIHPDGERFTWVLQ